MVGVVGVFGMAGAAGAQPADVIATVPADTEPAPLQTIGYSALPGGLHVPSADTLPGGAVQVGLLGGFGYRKGLLAADHSFSRGVGDFAIAFGATDMLSIGLSLDGRFDKHSGAVTDDGYVGDPHLFVRLGKAIGATKLGAQVGLWVPGKDAPSVAGSAISVDARALATLAAGPGALTLTAGFRLDNSLKSVDQPERLSAQDRVSLGVSEFNAALAGVSYTVPSNKVWFTVEGSTDVFVGTDAPSPIFRGGASVGYHLNDQWAILGFVEGAKVPGLSYGEVAMGEVTLVPYEPIVTGGLGLTARFGGPKAGSSSSIVKNDVPKAVEVIEYAELAGEVTDENGKPVVGAKVVVKLKNNTGSAVTDDKGAWSVTQLPIGKTIDSTTTLDDTGAEVTVEVDGKKPGKSTLTLVKGGNTATKIALDPILPDGVLKAIVKALATGKPIAGATVKVEPGGKTVTTDAEGKFQIEVPPGQYKITVTSPGLKVQQLDVTIDPNGVTIKNIDLSK